LQRANALCPWRKKGERGKGRIKTPPEVWGSGPVERKKKEKKAESYSSICCLGKRKKGKRGVVTGTSV